MVGKKGLLNMNNPNDFMVRVHSRLKKKAGHGRKGALHLTRKGIMFSK